MRYSKSCLLSGGRGTGECICHMISHQSICLPITYIYLYTVYCTPSVEGYRGEGGWGEGTISPFTPHPDTWGITQPHVRVTHWQIPHAAHTDKRGTRQPFYSPHPKYPPPLIHPQLSVCTRDQTKSFSHFANICSFVIAFSRKSILHTRENGVNKFTNITNIYAKLFSLCQNRKSYDFCPSMY